MLDPKRHRTGPDNGDFPSVVAATDNAARPLKRIKSAELFQSANEIEIDHEGRVYRLRVTQFNKLILTA